MEHVCKVGWDFHKVGDPKISAGMARPPKCDLRTALLRIRKSHGAIQQALVFFWVVIETLKCHMGYSYMSRREQTPFRQVSKEAVSKSILTYFACMMGFETRGAFTLHI